MGSEDAAFDVVVSTADASAVISLAGELDLATAPRLREAIIGLVDNGIYAVTVDMAHLDFLDSTGLAVLISALKRLRQHGGELRLQSPTARVLRVLALTGMTKLFPISRAQTGVVSR